MVAILSVGNSIAQTFAFQTRTDAAQPVQSARSPYLSPEKALLYSLAIAETPPADAVDRYGSVFDTVNYDKVMADEFQRHAYRERTTAILGDMIRNVDFSERFTFEGPAKFGEYSFETHAFPLLELPEGYYYLLVPAAATKNSLGSKVLLASYYFRAHAAANKKEFRWSIPMSAMDAAALVKQRVTGRPGEINRAVAVRFTYSLMSWMIDPPITPVKHCFCHLYSLNRSV